MSSISCAWLCVRHEFSRRASLYVAHAVDTRTLRRPGRTVRADGHHHLSDMLVVLRMRQDDLRAIELLQRPKGGGCSRLLKPMKGARNLLALSEYTTVKNTPERRWA